MSAAPADAGDEPSFTHLGVSASCRVQTAAGLRVRSADDVDRGGDVTGLLPGRVAVVTGGASGIGRASAIAIAEQGARAVIVADVLREPREGGQPTHELIAERTGARSEFVTCDVTAPDDVRRAVAAADPFGGVDLMVNVAGIFRAEDFLSVSEDAYDRMMDVNVKGTFFGAQAAANAMVRRGGGGWIVNISSIAGLNGCARFASYTAAKGAVRLLSYSLADELGPHGIRVNAIHPGLIATKMTSEDVALAEERPPSLVPLGRHGRPEDVAGAVVYLASDLASYVTGASLLIDGGVSRGQ